MKLDGYLVVLRHTMDDIPLLLTSDEQEAIDFAKTVGPDYGEREKITLNTDCGTPVIVAIYPFLDGKLVGMREVKDFTGDAGFDDSVDDTSHPDMPPDTTT